MMPGYLGDEKIMIVHHLGINKTSVRFTLLKNRIGSILCPIHLKLQKAVDLLLANTALATRQYNFHCHELTLYRMKSNKL